MTQKRPATERRRILFGLALILGARVFEAGGGSSVELTNIYSFSGLDGAVPRGALIQARDGSFYGSTYLGGPSWDPNNKDGSDGTVFKMTPAGEITTLYAFDRVQGSHPQGPVIQGTDGDFYGITADGFGTVFRVTHSGTCTTLYSFAGPDGSAPSALVQGTDGSLYGTTSHGGALWDGTGPSFGDGTVFRLDRIGALTTLYSFSGTNGAGPQSLVRSSDGNFFGVTLLGGRSDAAQPDGFGTVFKLSPDGQLTTLALFDGITGAGPTKLLQARDGDLYGTTASGGPQGLGTIFRVSREGAFTNIFSFSGRDGRDPNGLMQATDGDFYGTAYYGMLGSSDWVDTSSGAIFKISSTGRFQLLFALHGPDGRFPSGDLIERASGEFYGPTLAGGATRNGSIFRFTVPPPRPVLQAPLRSGKTITLTWGAAPGRTYQLQFDTNVGSTDWINLGPPIIATTTNATSADTLGTDSQRFYRVVLLP